MFKESNLLLELLIITGKSIYMLRHKYQPTVVQVNRPAASVPEFTMLSISRSRRASVPAADWLLLPDCLWIQWEVPSANRTTGTRRAEGWLQQSALLIQCVSLHSLSLFLTLLLIPGVRRCLKSYCPVLVSLFQAATQGGAAGAFGCKIITERYNCLQ